MDACWRLTMLLPAHLNRSMGRPSSATASSRQAFSTASRAAVWSSSLSKPQSATRLGKAVLDVKSPLPPMHSDVSASNAETGSGLQTKNACQRGALFKLLGEHGRLHQ